MLQAQGMIPDALPLPVETAPSVFDTVKGLLASHGVSQPSAVMLALAGSAVGVIFKRRQSN